MAGVVATIPVGTQPSVSSVIDGLVGRLGRRCHSSRLRTIASRQAGSAIAATRAAPRLNDGITAIGVTLTEIVEYVEYVSSFAHRAAGTALSCHPRGARATQNSPQTG